MRSRAATAVTVLALLAFALLCGSAMGASGRYVALGDSYTAGPLIPNQSLNPLGCLRSDHNYPHLVQPSLTTAQSTEAGTNPPQLDALAGDARVVTLGIGSTARVTLTRINAVGY